MILPQQSTIRSLGSFESVELDGLVVRSAAQVLQQESMFYKSWIKREDSLCETRLSHAR